MASKVSISLPDELLAEVERIRTRRRQSRSDFFRRAVETMVATDQEREALQRYARGYRDDPETESEEAWARVGESRLSEVDW